MILRGAEIHPHRKVLRNQGEMNETRMADISYTYYRNGLQKTVTDAQGTRTFTYIDEGQLDTETLNGVVIDRAYDNKGRSSGYSTAGILPASSINYGFDSFGRFSAITSSVDSVTSVVEYDYVPNSSLLSGYTAQAEGSAASLTVTKGYEPDRNLIVGVTNQIVGGSNAGLVSAFSYVNDDLGRRTRRDDQRSMGVSPMNSYWDFGYNSRSELTNAVRNLPNTTPVAGQSTGYSYDNIGNRRLVETSHDRKEIYTANELNQYVVRTVPSYVDVMGTATNIATVTVRDAAHTELPAPVIRQDDYFYKAYPVDNLSGFFFGDLEINAVINPAESNVLDIVKTETRSAFIPQTPEQFIYDDDGNMLSDGRFDYVWNGDNRLITVSNETALVASYAYDYLGRRISKTVGSETTTFLWNGNHIIHEESATKTNSYCWGQNDHLVSATLGGTNVFYCHDGNKNVTDLVDASGNAVAQYEFDPYGNINVKTGILSDANPFRFSNEYHDPETGHVAYMRRYLDTITSSWLNRDPIGEKGGLDLYGFVGNNPISNTDNLGLDFIAVGNRPVGVQAIANHMVLLFFKESTCYPTAETRMYKDGPNKKFLANATEVSRVELIPEHYRYYHWEFFPVIQQKAVGISFIRWDDVKSHPKQFVVVYGDTKDGSISDASSKWSTIALNANKYRFAEHGTPGNQLKNWPNSEYGWPTTRRHFNNSNTFVNEMAHSIGKRYITVGAFWNTFGSISPDEVRGAGLKPKPAY